jgi:hypothetical protein
VQIRFAVGNSSVMCDEGYERVGGDLNMGAITSLHIFLCFTKALTPCSIMIGRAIIAC